MENNTIVEPTLAERVYKYIKLQLDKGNRILIEDGTTKNLIEITLKK
jgi:hypothetical protein